MSRSRNYQRTRKPFRGVRRDTVRDPAVPDYALAYHEYLDTEVDYTTHTAWIGALIEAKTTYHRGKRRTGKARRQAKSYRAWNRFTRALCRSEEPPAWKIKNLANSL